MPNLLSEENSPYLLQHKDNPINWYPWGKKALEKAKKENKLIFLSIGYSTCFWCHKMAKEAFSDEKIAEFLNENFISIKVDKEERPDIDTVYMEAALMLTDNAGWPLNMFLTPDMKPFFAGTYFPVKESEGMISFLTLLKALNKKWNDDPELIMKSGDEIVDNLNRAHQNKERINDDSVKNANWLLKSIFDERNGGFGSAPKFPMAHQIFFLLRYWYLYNDEYSLYMVEKTLDNIANGEIYDKKDGGFYRYATKADWSEPHYEKMLYTNMLMVIAFLEGYEVIQKSKYKQVVEETLKYAENFLMSKEGGFFAAQDSESKDFVDKKIVTNLNALAIVALSKVAKALNNSKYLDLAIRAEKFIYTKLYDEGLKSYIINDEAYNKAYSYDYVCYIWALIELYQASYDNSYLEKAKKLNEELIKNFWDENQKGVFLYSKKAEKLIANPKEIYDGAVPSTNSICTMNFLKLSRLLNDYSLTVKADEIMNSCGKLTNESPVDYLFMLCAYMYYITPKEVIISDSKEKLDMLNGHFRPFTLEMIER